MRKTILLYTVILAVLFVFSGSRALATQYFVDSKNGNDRNPGTNLKSAWKTLDAVNTKEFSPGDVINFIAGSEWKGELIIRSSGTKEKPIIFQVYGKGEKTVISNPDPGKNVINITGKWIIVDGFLVKDSMLACINIAKGAEHNIVRNCEMTNGGMGVGAYGKYNLFTLNYVHNLHMIKNSPREVNNNDDYGSVAFWMFAPCNEISYNKGINCKSPSYDYGYDGGFFEIFGNGDSSYVHHNWGEKCNGFHESGGGSSRGVVIAYNVSVSNGDIFCLHTGRGFHSEVENLRVENNTIIELEGTPNVVMMWGGGTPTKKMVIFRNNIVVIGGKSSVKVSENGGFLHENNLYYLLDGTTIGYQTENNEILADPLFIDMKAKDFRLNKKSPAIGAGINLGYTTDFAGGKLPAIAKPNIGAY